LPDRAGELEERRRAERDETEGERRGAHDVRLLARRLIQHVRERDEARGPRDARGVVQQAHDAVRLRIATRGEDLRERGDRIRVRRVSGPAERHRDRRRTTVRARTAARAMPTVWNAYFTPGRVVAAACVPFAARTTMFRRLPALTSAFASAIALSATAAGESPAARRSTAVFAVRLRSASSPYPVHAAPPY